MASDFLRRLLKRGAESSQRPKLDVHALYTNCQMSRIITQGQLSVHEPWRKHKKKPKSVHASLYTNDSTPFLVWYTDKWMKKPRGYFNIQGGKVAPIGEYSFQIVFSGKNNQVYKFNTECWEKREEWLYALRDESRREATMPQLSNVTPSLMESQDDIAIAQQTQPVQRPPWRGHRRTLSAGSPSPQLDRCQVQLQRSRSQPHIQKGKLIKKRPTLLNSNKPNTVGQSIQGQKYFVRSPEVCRS